MREAWNHNIHYHSLVLATVPNPCRRVLDVGCGQGLLTRKLAGLCGDVVGIDCDPVDEAAEDGVRFVVGDVMTFSFEDASFDCVTAIAVLHHLPLRPALMRFRELLAPGGVLVVVGLYRQQTLLDLVAALVGLHTSIVMRAAREYAHQQAAMREPEETLEEIRAAVAECLPGAVLRRRLYLRYTIVWRKPEAA